MKQIDKLHVTKQVVHRAHYVTHISYLVLVFVESHGMYGIAAGVLGVVVLVDGIIDRRIHSVRKESNDE